jgi:hypothetical protein
MFQIPFTGGYYKQFPFSLQEISGIINILGHKEKYHFSLHLHSKQETEELQLRGGQEF